MLPLDALIVRVRGEFREMPGLKLTFAQACRLWQIDPEQCHAVLEALVRDGWLVRTREGAFIAAGGLPVNT